MGEAAPLAEIWRGEVLESVHKGHAAICDATGAVIEGWGDPETVILPRSSSKMIQALPLVTSGAADDFGLRPEHFALACASHEAAEIHLEPVRRWMDALGLGDDAFRCGPQEPRDRAVRERLIRAHGAPCQIHNNCSGKHAGFLTLTRHLGAGPEYVEIDHPVQIAVREAFAQVTGEEPPTWAIDGCSAPNFAASLRGLARAMAWYATADRRDGVADRAAARLVQAMVAHPDLVAGEGRACTLLMRAMKGRAAIKTGAEGVFVAIVPEKGLGIAIKAADGAGRAAECAIAALLVRLGVLEADHPAARRFLHGPIRNWRGIETGHLAPAAELI